MADTAGDKAARDRAIADLRATPYTSGSGPGPIAYGLLRLAYAIEEIARMMDRGGQAQHGAIRAVGERVDELIEGVAKIAKAQRARGGEYARTPAKPAPDRH